LIKLRTYHSQVTNKDPEIKKRVSKKLTRKIPNPKRLESFPAVKIGRLAVHTDYQKQGIGTQLIDFIKAFFITNNKTGCRFITADAYQESLKFYERNGFKFLTDKDKGKKARLMYFDLFTFQKS